MKVAVDVGNTTIQIGLFEDDNLIERLSFMTDHKKTADEFLASINVLIKDKGIDISKVNHLIYSSVVPEVNAPLKLALEKAFKVRPLCLGPGVKSGIPLLAENPSEVGSDLIADCAGARAKYGYPTIIADLGTATKIILLDKTGSFSSVLIMPGISISSSNLSNKAALLPSVALETPKSTIARNTVACMNAGAVFGHADMIIGLANRMEREIGYTCKKILTGGGSVLIKDIVKEDYEYDSDLNLFGLNVILNKNIRK